MKKYIHYFLWLSIVYIADAQDPRVPHFDNVEVEWLSVIQDTNFVDNGGGWGSPYNFFQPIYLNHNPEDNLLFGGFQGIAQSPGSGVGGPTFQLLDASTGEVQSRRTFNFFTGEINRIGGYHVIQDSEGNYEFLGYQQSDTADYSQPDFTFFGNPISLIFDSNTGELLSRNVGQNAQTDGVSLFNQGNTLGRNSSGQAYISSIDYPSIDSFMHTRHFIHRLDDDMNIDYDNVYIRSYPTQIGSTVSVPFLMFRAGSTALTDDVLAVVHGEYFPGEPDICPKHIYLDFVDISEVESSSVMHSVDITASVDCREGDIGAKVSGLYSWKEKVVVMMTRERNFGTGYKFLNSLHIYNLDGSLYANVNDWPEIEKRVTWPRIVTSHDDKLYIYQLYRGVNDGKQAYRLYEVGEGEDNLTEISSIDFPLVSTHEYYIDDCQLLPSNDLIANIAVRSETPDGDSYFADYTMRISADQIGLDPLSSKEIESGEISLTLHPNPASHFIQLEIPESQIVLSLEILSSTGAVVRRVDHLSYDSRVDVKALRGGYYTVRLVTDQGVASRSFIKID